MAASTLLGRLCGRSRPHLAVVALIVLAAAHPLAAKPQEDLTEGLTIPADDPEPSAPSAGTPSLGVRRNGGVLRQGGGGTDCLTPDDRSGQCITVNTCPPLVALLRQRPVPPENVQFLQNSQCGFAGHIPKVCCPKTSDRYQPRPRPPPKETDQRVWPAPATPRPAPRPQPPQPNLPNLPNLHLLPTDSCGLDLSERIFGGTQTELGEFPWMALLQYRTPRRGLAFLCGGALITKRYVLTAAHCIGDQTYSLVSVRLGEHDTTTSPDCRPDLLSETGAQICAQPAVDIPVEQEIAYPEYRKTDPHHYNDVALVRLTREAEFTDFIKPICLPIHTELSKKNYVGSKLWVAGWGRTETRSESDVKLKLAVPVVSNADCGVVYRKAAVELSDSFQMCAGGQKGNDSCQGDSGGPLMSADNTADGVRWHVTGIVSFGPVKCGQAGFPGIYTRVGHYVPWILDTIRG